jgi:hypothetical protein
MDGGTEYVGFPKKTFRAPSMRFFLAHGPEAENLNLPHRK